jgi:hypothetical protein
MITLDDIAGYCTEKTIWTLLKALATQLESQGPARIEAQDVTLGDDDITIVGKPTPCSEADAVWSLGALANYLSSGHPVFGGKGPAYQAAHPTVPLPVLRRDHSTLTPTVQDCLRHETDNRISLHEITQRADSALAKKETPIKPTGAPSADQAAAPLPDPLKEAWPEAFRHLATILLLILALTCSNSLQAQTHDQATGSKLTETAPQDAFLRRYVDIVFSLKLPNRSPADYRRAVDTIASPRFPKIALLDDIGDDPSEFRGAAANPFRLSSVVVQAYERQQGVENSRGYYYDSRQRGIHYSMIEKSISARSKARYSIREHSGRQEIVIIPFRPDQRYEVHIYCRGQEVKGLLGMKPDKYHHYTIASINADEEITIVIDNQSAAPLSFAILNYNARKK